MLLARRRKNVDVIGHQDERVNVAAAPRSRLSQAIQEAQPVVAREEDRLSIVAAHDEVLRQAGEIDSLLSGH
ncbi:MAG TPA: hypothetical protein VLT60_08435, partial [Usitatibacter sp.]|nr:hypothetical protein [Usitatibacter sp.]